MALLIAIVCAISACARGGESDTLSEKVVYTDALGRSVEIKKRPQRVAALLGSFADVWTLAGGTVCASVDDMWEDYAHEQGDAVDLGGAHSPNIELLLGSEPELVLASASTAADVAMKDTLEAVGITVVYFDVDDFYDYLDMLDVCTDITERKDLYEIHGLNVKSRIDEIKTRYANSGIDERVNTVLFVRATSSAVKAKGSSGTVLGEMLSDIGCINIADSDKTLLETLSIESILREDPYHIFAVPMGNSPETATELLLNIMEENPAWRTLEAVKENRVHIMDKNLFSLKPNARWAEAYEILYEILTAQ